MSWTRQISIGLFASLTCACGSSSTAPAQAYPDLSGTWRGHLGIDVTLPGAPPVTSTCIHQWTIGSSVGGQITGNWQSSSDLQGYLVPCQQSGPLTGTVSPSGAISLSFNAILGVTGCAGTGEGDVLSGSIYLNFIEASGLDTIHCPGLPNESRSLSFSMVKQ